MKYVWLFMLCIHVLGFWIPGFIFFLTNNKTKYMLWSSCTLFLCGIGTILIPIEDPILTEVTDTNLKGILIVSVECMRALSNIFIPYTGLMFSITYSNIFIKKEKLNKMAPILLFIIPFFMLIFYPFYYQNPSRFLMWSIWIFPYTILACSLLIYGYKCEKDYKIKLQRLVVAFVIVPVSINALIANFILRALGFEYSFKLNTFIIPFWFVLFLIIITRHGILGVKLNVDKRLDNTVRGTAMLNHTIKNEVFKIALCMDNIVGNMEKLNFNSGIVHENVEIVKESVEYLQLHVKRIQTHIGEIELNENKHSLGDLFQHEIKRLSCRINEKNILISVKNDNDPDIICDAGYMQEAVGNIIGNAVEALDCGGRIDIEIAIKHSWIVLMICDNGSGISKEDLKYIFDPFYSKKKNAMNFGLGLYFTQNIIQKHGGSIEIQSEIGKGTRVHIHLPKYRLAGSIIEKEGYLWNK